VQGTRSSQRLSLERVLRERLAAADLVPVHRLDRETSGVLVFARDAATARRLGHAFAARRVEKRYVAAVWPAPALTEFTVHGWIERAPDPARFRFALAETPGPGRRESETHFIVRATHGGGALVDAVPMTGRTHQIRVHLAAAGSPISGDPVYGRADAPTADRCLLHAASLRICFDDGTHLALDAPWPEDLRNAITGGRNPRKPTALDDGNPA
jgi:23S rRNA-/tRNA-specific pseudouridylate synthase